MPPSSSSSSSSGEMSFKDDYSLIRTLMPIVVLYLLSKSAQALVKYSRRKKSSIEAAAEPMKAAQRIDVNDNSSSKLGQSTTITLQISLILLQAVLLYQASTKMETMVVIRLVLLYLLFFVLILFTIGSPQDPTPSGNIDTALMVHFIATLQTYLLPGMWDLMEVGIETRRFIIVYAVWYSVFTWGVGGLLFWVYRSKKMSRGEDVNGNATRRDDDINNTNAVPHEQLVEHQENIANDKDYAGVFMLLATDVILSVFFNCKSLT